jgi:DNA replicative helicase MCM subunit Mcm2 (Cdc46/Mcm family)
MTEALTTMILLNIALDTAQLENMEEELLYQVILHPTNSISLLQELTTEITLSTKIQKLLKI